MEGYEALLQLLFNAKSKEQLAGLLELLLTPEEIEAFSKRVLILKSLLNGTLTQREISKEFGLSISKITRGSNALKRIDEETKEYVEKCLKK